MRGESAREKIQSTTGYRMTSPAVLLRQGGGFFVVRLFGEKQGLALDFRVVGENQPTAEHGHRPDYGSGPYMALMASAVRLARSDLTNPIYSEEARSFLDGELVALFAECLGFEGSF